ncbi:MAG TPA: hypothetical protein PLX65_11000 [Accumulibacter sp.]|nr:hypothetical protein [Accumulibacter sp.]
MPRFAITGNKCWGSVSSNVGGKPSCATGVVQQCAATLLAVARFSIRAQYLRLKTGYRSASTCLKVIRD